MINRFISKHKVLSNFEAASVVYEHITFPTVEHAYVAAKSRDMEFRRQIATMPIKHAGKAKKWGLTVELRMDWEKVKLGIMEELLIQKFDPDKNTLNIPNPNYEVLKNTGDQLLVEGNFWHDNFWGNCLCDKCMKIEGKNHLGLLLMKVREFYSLKDEGFINLEATS
jgi:ribA/ribD-fused uncharacterized protein